MKKIQLIKSTDIDSQKWNQLIHESPNGLIYAYTWYLDMLCEKWNALIYGDYKAVMPLPTKMKFGFQYVYQPAFIQQLGVISKDSAVDKYLNEFIPYLKKHYTLVDIKLNFNHSADQVYPNYTLSLHKSLEEIQTGFNRSFKEAFKQSKKTIGEFYYSDDIDAALEFNAQLYDYRSVELTGDIYQRFGKLSKYLFDKNQCLIPTWSVNGKVMAQAIVLMDERRYYLMTSACLEEGRRLRANHALMYHLLKSLSQQEKIFDFEGSSIPGVAKFYESMGGQIEYYPPLKKNFLPRWLSWVKKL